MVRTTEVKGDLIPYQAGVVIVTPLDTNGKRKKSEAVATQKDFLQSTQIVESRTSEELPNGNGSDKPFMTQKLYTLTVIANTYDPRFHACVAGRLESQVEANATTTIVPKEWSAEPQRVGDSPYTYEIAFGTTAASGVSYTPAADADGEIEVMVQDTYGNWLEDISNSTTTTVLAKGNFKYDSATNILSVSSDYNNVPLRGIVYVVCANGAMKTTNDEMLKAPQFHIAVFGYARSASSEEAYPRTTYLKKATYNGDITDPATQKSISNPLTYTFQSAPVPEGTKVFEEIIEQLPSA